MSSDLGGFIEGLNGELSSMRTEIRNALSQIADRS